MSDIMESGEQTMPKVYRESFVVVQWLRLHVPNAGGPVSIPGQGTRARMLQLRAHN